MRQEQRHAHVVQGIARGAPEHEFPEPRVAIGAHDDESRPEVTGPNQERLGGVEAARGMDSAVTLTP